MSRTSTLAVLALAGCDLGGPPPSGTSVGNPGKTYLTLGRAEGLTFDDAAAEGLSVDLVGCDEQVVPIILPSDSVRVLDADPHVVSAGTWCGLALTVDRLVAEGNDGGEGRFELTLEPPSVITLWAAAPEVVDETDYVLELAAPGWITAEDLPGPGDGGISTITPESEIGAVLAEALVSGSAWYADDGDGVIDETERTLGPIASAALPPPAELGAADDTGSDRSVAIEGCGGCNSTTTAPGWFGAAVLVWFTRASSLARSFRARRRTAGPRRSAGCSSRSAGNTY